MKKESAASASCAAQKTQIFKVYSLKRKILGLTSLVLAALTAALTYVSFISYREDALSRSASMLQDTVEQVAVNLENYFVEINRASMQLFYNSAIMEALAAEPSDVALTRLERRRLIEDELRQTMLLSRNDVLSCYIIADDLYRVAQTVSWLDIDRDYDTAQWYKDALAGRGFALLVSETGDSQIVCSIVRRINSISNVKKLIGIAKINFSYDGIADICNIVQSEYSGHLCILSETGKPVYGSLPDGVEFHLLKEGVTSAGSRTEYLVNRVSVPTTGWQVLLLHPVQELEAGAYLTMLRMVGIALVSLLLACAAMLITMRSFLTPLGNVISSMQSIRNGNQDERVPVGRSDEIGYLAISFNEMLDRIKATQDENTSLLKEIYEAELLQRDIQMQVLSRQIEPHFIFNTLNMIAIEAEMGKTDQCVENIGRLSMLLRALAHNEAPSTLGSELTLIQNYLLLYQARYADRLSFSINVPKRFEDIAFPSLSLQPLVENAIQHGCELTSRHTHVAIEGRCEGEELWLSVRDNACGMPQETLEALCAALAEEGGGTGGIGIPNVHRRIRLFYGDSYGLSLHSDANGTCVTLRIPILPEESE